MPHPDRPDPAPGAVSERLSVPLAWWLLATGFVLSLGVAVYAFLGPVWGIGVTLFAEVLVGWGLVGFGATRVVVDDEGITVGRARIGYRYVAAVVALDADHTIERLRTRADPAAYLVVRPYIRTSVEISVSDPADPHPYWLVSSRHAARLADHAAQRLAGPGDPRPVRASERSGAEPADG